MPKPKMAQNPIFFDFFGPDPPKMAQTALNFIFELIRVSRTEKKCWNWILKESQKFDLWIHRNPPKCQPIYGLLYAKAENE